MPTIDHSNPLPSCKGPDCRALQTWKEKCREAERRLEIAERAALACSRPLVWTDEAPKKPGWYWLRNERSVIVVEVDDELVYAYGGHRKRTDLELERDEWTWAGPIPEPVEPKE